MARRANETVKEQCSCGASFEYTGPYPTSMVVRWRENHICPNRPPKQVPA